MNQHPELFQEVRNIATEVTSGVYYSRFALGVDNLILPTRVSEIRVEAQLPQAGTVQAIGMAALPNEYKDQQLTSLTYNGMTSAAYAARHAEWLNTFQYVNDVMDKIEASADDDGDEEGGNSRHASQKRASLAGKK